MSTQVLSTQAVQDGLKDILLNHTKLWEALRPNADNARTAEDEALLAAAERGGVPYGGKLGS